MKVASKCAVILKMFVVAASLRNLRRLYSAEQPHIKHSMLLIAHPDDESMFFSPFLFCNNPVVILCLSNGDYDSLGNIRSAELRALCAKRGWNLVLSDHKDGYDWCVNTIAANVLDVCTKYNVENIVTFDERGISGHKNHVSCYKAMQKLKNRLDPKYLGFYCLKTVNIFEKYVFSLSRPTYQIPFFSLYGLANMLYHYSQFVWFRFLYILFSSYMYFNEVYEMS